MYFTKEYVLTNKNKSQDFIFLLDLSVVGLTYFWQQYITYIMIISLIIILRYLIIILFNINVWIHITVQYGDVQNHIPMYIIFICKHNVEKYDCVIYEYLGSFNQWFKTLKSILLYKKY